MSPAVKPRVGYWLTPAGCVAAGGHTTDGDGSCTVCGGQVPWTSAQMLARAVEQIEEGSDPQTLVDAAIAWREKWARLVEEQESGVQLDGRASIYTGETYTQARHRWAAYLELLTDHLSGVENGLT